MPKVKRDRITATQFDTALTEQINYARSMNIRVNEVSVGTMFAMMLRKRLYGGDNKLSQTANEVVSRLMQDAKAERAQYELEEKERQRQSESHIITPGDSRFRH